MKVVECIDSDVKETSVRIDHQTRELKQLESKVDNLVDRLAFLEQANIEKEGWIDCLDTGGEGQYTQWVHCELIVGSETICPAYTQQVSGGHF